MTTPAAAPPPPPIHAHQRPSRYHRSRNGRPVTLLVLHADGSRDAGATIDYLTGLLPKGRRVSYHYLIGRTGGLYQFVSTDRAAYHAGVSEYPNATHADSVNDASIGVSFSNAQDGREPFTEQALRAGARLVANLVRRYPALRAPDMPGGVRMTTHAAVARPPGRKVDPGALFPAARFAQMVSAELGGP